MSNLKCSNGSMYVMGVDVLWIDFTALILWENGSEQGMERMCLKCQPPSSTFTVKPVLRGHPRDG